MAHFAAALAFPLGGDPVDLDARAVLLDAYGQDILFLDEFTIGDAGDYTTVEGPDNLRLAILHGFMTTPGDYKLDPSYGAGFPRYLGKPDTQSNRDEMRQAAMDFLLSDDRIQAVDSVDVTSETINGVKLSRVSSIVTAAGRQVQLGYLLQRSN